MNSGVLRLLNAKNNETLPANATISKSEAWEIVSAIWHERRESSQIIKGADNRASSLSDLVHSMGAARVASFLAPLIALVLVAEYAKFSLAPGDIARFIGMIMLALIIIGLHHCAYRDTGLSAQRVIDQMLYDALLKENISWGAPITAHVMLSPIKEGWYSRLIQWFRCLTRCGTEDKE